MLKHSGGIMGRLIKYPDRLVNNNDDPQKEQSYNEALLFVNLFGAG
ncbi:MAG: hypothetical protein HQ553_01225 [Chloroflexi bacterium]|nr:hypothetical protein [Chloroflexota bacterium]